MARIVWKAKNLVSLKLRDDLYTIAQMEDDSILRCFDIFNTNGVWHEINLNNIKQIFRVYVGRVVNQKLAVCRIKDPTVIPSNQLLKLYWIKPYTRLDANYPGSEFSFSFLGGRLVRINEKMFSIEEIETIQHDLSPVKNKEIIEKYEMTNMWGDKDLGDRLRRYFDTGINRDDLKFEVFPGLWDDRETLRPLTRRLPIPLR